MAKFFSFLFFAAIVGGIIWYENQPTTVTIPVKTSDQIDYYQQPTTTQVPATVTHPQRKELDFSEPDLQLEIHGVNGDEVLLREKVGKPKHLASLPEDVRSVIMSCPGVTDRDMVVPVQSRLELQSSLAAKVSVDYNTLDKPAVYQFSDGLQCDEGTVSHQLEPGGSSKMDYWVVLSGVVTPDYPDGDFRNSWTLNSPVLTLPSLEKMHWSMWGPRVVNCNTILGDESHIWLAGIMPQMYDGCTLADTKDSALGN